MQLKQRQKGFTLVEIAVVLVIIGLLLGGVLKGQELISSARVRNMADQQAGIQAAYYGFQDRYRAVPGDMPSDDASDAIGESISAGGNGDGALADPADDKWLELSGVWEQLSKAGFIQGSYQGTANDSTAPTSDEAPINVFNGVVVLGRHSGYYDSSGTINSRATAARLVLTMGHNVPVDIARELDVKVDDGKPRTGTLRNAIEGAAIYEADSSAQSCITTDSGGNPIWDIASDSQNCNPAFLF